MKPREVEFRRLDYRDVAVVPLGRFGDQFAIILKEDYLSLLANGLSGNWYVTGIHNVMARKLVDPTDPDSRGQSVSVARLLMGAKARQTVRYLDSNGRNLRRQNLRLVNGFSLSDMAEYNLKAAS